MAMRGEKTAAMLPEPRPDSLAIGLRNAQLIQLRPREKCETPFLHRRREHFQSRLQFKQKHEPMRLALETVFADHAGEMKVFRREVQAEFFGRLARGTGVRRFTIIHVQFATARTPETAIRLLRTFEQQHFVPLIKTIEQRGDFVRQLHARSEAIASIISKRFQPKRKKPGCESGLCFRNERYWVAGAAGGALVAAAASFSASALALAALASSTSFCLKNSG